MSYLDTKPTFTRTTGSTLETWFTLLDVDSRYRSTFSELSGLSMVGPLDAVEFMPAGGMTVTGLGSPFPMLIQRCAV